MAEIIEDRVQESTTSTGTGALALAGAIVACRTFSSVCAIGDTFYGTIVAVDSNGAPQGPWECGHYTYSANNTITRTTVTASSNSNSPVNFGTGVKRVFIDLTAAQIKNFQSNATSTSTTPYGQDPSLFAPTPIFDEEFNGSALDSNTWNTAIWYQTPDSTINFNVANGSLSIWPDLNYVNRTIDTDGKFYLNAGTYVEAKIKFNTGLGATSNFWLYNHDTATHPGVSISHTFDGTAGYSSSNYHPTNFKCSVDSSDSTNVGSINAANYVTVPDLSTAFHIYAVKWTSSGFTFYFDGAQVGSTISASFTSRMYILLTLWFTASGDPNGAPSTANTPQGQGNSMQVDYVRAWTIK